MSFGPGLGVELNSAGGGGFRPGQTVIVAKSGGQFNTIQAAVNFAAAYATVTTQYAIWVFPGIYVEDVVMANFTHLIGMGDTGQPVVILSAGGDTLTLPAGSSCMVKNVRLESTHGRVVNIPASVGGHLTHIFMEVWTQCQLTDASCEMIYNFGNQLVYWNGKMHYEMTGATVGVNSHRCVACYDTAELFIHSAHIEMDISEADDTVECIYLDPGALVHLELEGNWIDVDVDDAAWAGDACAVAANGEGPQYHIRGNDIYVHTNGVGNTYGIRVESATGAVMYSQANKIRVTGGINSYAFDTGLAGHDVIYSHYDQLIAADWVTGNGSFQGQYSPQEGYQHGTSSLTIPRLNLNDYLPCVMAQNEDDYNPVGLGNTSALVLTGAAPYYLSGIAAPANNNWGDAQGRMLMIFNGGQAGGATFTLQDDGVGSVNVNRFNLGQDLALAPGSGCLLYYDNVNGRWRCAGYWSQLPDYIKVSDLKAATTDGGTFTLGAWRTRNLNTEDSDDGGHCVLAANQITLVAGTYICAIQCPAYNVQRHKARLQNITDGATVIMGSNEYASNVSASTNSFIVGQFTLAAAKVMEVQHRCQTTMNNQGFGLASSFGVDEIYTVAEFWKVA